MSLDFAGLCRQVADDIDAFRSMPVAERPERLRAVSVKIGLLIDAAKKVQEEMGIERITLGDYLERLKAEGL